MPILQFQASSRRSLVVVASGFLVVVLSACGGTPTVSDPQQLDRQRQQARDALTRWADAVAAGGGQQGFVIVGDATGQVGDWEVAVGGNNKLALMSGKVVAVVGLPDETPAAAEVHWKDGSVQTLPTISASQALRDLQASGVQACAECDPLKVTAARLTTAQVETSRGGATVPAWEFTLQGTAVHVTRVAIAARANVSVTPPPWNANDPPVGLSIESASGTVAGRELIVTFVGAPEPATKPCGADYDAEAVESPTAVVVIVIQHRNSFAGACTDVGATRTANVQLLAPLGDRAVLEVKEGLPVPVTLVP